jgi:MSHA biogenesis protein MshL
MNNHKALIKVVRNEVYFIAEVESQVVAQVGVTQTTNFVPQIVPIGVTLDVTPQVSDTNRITMHLHPSVSEVVEVTQQPKTDPLQETPGSLPVIDVRETDTVVTVDDSQTLVIGGLMQSRNIKRNKKLPLLGDIPYLGTLFREEKIEEQKTELVILLTPRVLDPPRIARIETERMDRWKRADELRLERQEEKPWWRVPYGEEYGIKP